MTVTATVLMFGLATHQGSPGGKGHSCRVPKADLARFNDDAQVFGKTIGGNAHAAISSRPKPRFGVLENPGTPMMASAESLEKSNDAVAKSKRGRDALNVFSNRVTANTDNGWPGTAHSCWFDTRDRATKLAPVH